VNWDLGIFFACLQIFITHADGSRVGMAFSGVYVFACLSVCFPHDISTIDATRITKFDVVMFHHES